uniref:Retrovirus-related Pol polyprotein from transposon TNT 1-94 n=1 Tax=Tanacetum cinerariifolium TaxID=118510 RepID=A0A6L2M9H3_TANCI|nr:hypothetical protein [Tanacetum cinerariifolium]
MSMMGEMTFFLGLQVNQSLYGIFINQSKYVLEILNKYGMESCDPGCTPMEIKDKLDLDQNGTPASGFELTGFPDADYAGCKDSFMSTSGGAQFLGEKLLTDYGFHFNKIPIYCDSKSAIAISCNPVQHSRTKHIAVHYHFIMKRVEKGTIELYFVKTNYQLADIFTKALPTDCFTYLVRRLARAGGIYPGTLPLDRVEVLAESKCKTPMLGHQDKYMMKAQVHVSKSSAISDVQTLPQKKLYRQNVKAYVEGRLLASFQDREHKGGDTRSQDGIKDNDVKI